MFFRCSSLVKVSVKGKGATLPFHVDAAGGSKHVEAVEDPVAGHLDTPHWRNKEKLEAEVKQKQPRMLTHKVSSRYWE